MTSISPLLVAPPTDSGCVTCPCDVMQQWPDCLDLCIYEGDDVWFDVNLTDDYGNPIDLTGYTAQAQIRPYPTSPIILASFDCTVTGNTIELHLTSLQNRAMGGDDPSTGWFTSSLVWDLQLLDAAVPPNISTLLYGKVTVMHDVTRIEDV